ncbi:MAG TPA: glycosyltransferase family 4 protein [Gemmatimonadales bacterium]|nr:glycosyltransferase family 4 protein [Gemmatimonadales bacterium]
MTPLRVAMVAACPFPWPRGTPIRIQCIAEAVADRGHSVHVVTYHLGEAVTGCPYHIHRIPEVPTYRRTAPGPSVRKLLQLDPMLARLLRRLHHELRFDIVHAHHYEGLLVASIAVPGLPIVYDAHTLLAGELPTYRLGLPSWLVRAAAGHLDRRLPRRADRIIAVSETIRDTLVRLGAAQPQHLHLIPNGVEYHRFPVEPRITPDDHTVIFTGNLAPYQGVDLLLEAFATLHARRADTRLLIVSDSPFEPFEALAEQLGIRNSVDVRQASFAQQPALLAGAAIAVNPRVQCDGIPQKLLNYMAAGMPIATFEGSAGPVRHEVTGLRVRNGDTAAMADAMERLLSNPVMARRMGDTAREQARRDFSWAQVAAQVEQVYRAVLETRTGDERSITLGGR